MSLRSIQMVHIVMPLRRCHILIVLKPFEQLILDLSLNVTTQYIFQPEFLVPHNDGNVFLRVYYSFGFHLTLYFKACGCSFASYKERQS